MKHGRHAKPTRHSDKLPTSNRARTLTISIVVLVVCGAGAAYLDMEIQRGEFYNRGQALNALRSNLAETQGDVESRQRALDELQTKERRLDSLDQQKGVLTTEIAAMERELAATRAELADMVRDVRTKATGTTFAELRLVNGQVLSGVRLVNVSNSEISVSHDRGTVRLPAANLPLALQERFRFGTLPTDAPAPAKPPLPGQASARPAAAAAAAPAPNANAIAFAIGAGAPMTSAEKSQRMQTLNTTVVSLRARLLAMETQARSDSAKEIRKNARAERLYSTSTQQSQSTKTMEQLEREGRRKFAEESARAAVEAAKNKEMDALRSKISLIEGEIQRMASDNP